MEKRFSEKNILSDILEMLKDDIKFSVNWKRNEIKLFVKNLLAKNQDPLEYADTKPKLKALVQAASDAVWAAKGVPLRAPLKPELPDEAQQTVFPNMSLIVTIVLLNVVFMFATPTATDFFCFFFAFVFAIKYYLFSSCK